MYIRTCKKREVGRNTRAQIHDAKVSVCAKKHRRSTKEDIIYQRVWKNTRDHSVTVGA